MALSGDDEDTGVGEPRVHAAGARRAGSASQVSAEAGRNGRASASTPLAGTSGTRGNLRVVDGGAGRKRIDLGPDPADRLRSGRGSEVRVGGTSRANAGRRSQSGRRGRRG